MGLAKSFQKSVKKDLKFHAAWIPVANTFRVGTYGLVEGGVLRSLGHITDDFGIDIGELEKGNATTLDFESKGVTTIRTVAGLKVDAFPDAGDVDAGLAFEFSDSDSVVLKTPVLDYRSMPSVQKVANQLAKHDDWSNSYRVVSGIYKARTSVVLLASEEQNAEIDEGTGDERMVLRQTKSKDLKGMAIVLLRLGCPAFF